MYNINVVKIIRGVANGSIPITTAFKELGEWERAMFSLAKDGMRVNEVEEKMNNMRKKYKKLKDAYEGHKTHCQGADEPDRYWDDDIDSRI
jgi:hypothetical protein